MRLVRETPGISFGEHESGYKNWVIEATEEEYPQLQQVVASLREAGFCSIECDLKLDEAWASFEIQNDDLDKFRSMYVVAKAGELYPDNAPRAVEVDGRVWTFTEVVATAGQQWKSKRRVIEVVAVESDRLCIKTIMNAAGTREGRATWVRKIKFAANFHQI